MTFIKLYIGAMGILGVLSMLGSATAEDSSASMIGGIMFLGLSVIAGYYVTRTEELRRDVVVYKKVVEELKEVNSAR